ncbi:hypothetical protein [Vibrio sagamiensis]|nr:hypothetical protein [Vibrio sagamiensis]PNQ71232.1 MSHA biogenesis protein MshA [Vibrio agarivorans]
MRKSLGLSTIEWVTLLTVLGTLGIIVLPKLIGFESESYEKTWQQTEAKAEHISEILSNKETYDEIKQELEYANKWDESK